MRFSTTVVAAIGMLMGARPATAQPGDDTLRVLDGAMARVRRVGPLAPDSIWPRFRPDTIPLVFVFPGRGAALFGWSGAPPEGYTPLRLHGDGFWAAEAAAGAASTSTALAGRSVAQVVVRALDVAELAGTAVHEAFHVFERHAVQAGGRFGASENSALVSRYPVFDPVTEADFALEGRLLDDAMAAPTPTAARELARQFVAVREARHRRLSDELARFERMAELNEGLAEYALVRTLTLITRDPDAAVAAAARQRLDERRPRLRSLTHDAGQSVRLRFYSTGPAIAALLDRFEGPTWRRRLVEEDLSLQDALALATGYRAAETALRIDAMRRYGAAALRSEARKTVAALRARRQAQLDSVLARPGVRLVVDASRLAQRDVGLCGFDPQNILRVSPSVELHTRWVRPCSTATTFGEFNTPVVHDESAGTITAVIGLEPQIRLSVGGSAVQLANGEIREAVHDIRITSPTASYQAGLGTLLRRDGVLRLTLLPEQ